ncbi:D-serine ammonia-lyase [Helcococcus massiliensis]|uniref:D-serine ammonia-lyase n=1 Tax=Helcococcus massiliensis TaxID=2040290 RepID=UPI000CDEA810|nr:D-serine ammonia-lyase [Helcococcus massiliensis]
MYTVDELISKSPILAKVARLEPTVWINPDRKTGKEAWENVEFTYEDIEEANERFTKFGPLLVELFSDEFPEIIETRGILESDLVHLTKMEEEYKNKYGLKGNLYLKLDSHMPVVGSIKARGGLYEVLVFSETLAKEHKLIDENKDYTQFLNDEFKDLFSQYTVQVASTGNLGISVGVMAAALGFNAIVHMSNDAKQWKKDHLRERGATVIEYDGEFSFAISEARKISDKDPYSYFVDDENSKILFKGYSTSAIRTEKQLKEMGIKVDEDHPVFVYCPCGVGGSSGGVAFGFRKVLGDNVHAFFVETTHIPSFLIGASTKLHSNVSVHDLGIDGITEADGLSVARPSKFSGENLQTLLSGVITCEDDELFDHLRDLDRLEDIRIEPSSCASIAGAVGLFNHEESLKYLKDNNLLDKMENATHICWATGGNLVPEEEMQKYLNR